MINNPNLKKIEVPILNLKSPPHSLRVWRKFLQSYFSSQIKIFFIHCEFLEIFRCFGVKKLILYLCMEFLKIFFITHSILILIQFFFFHITCVTTRLSISSYVAAFIFSSVVLDAPLYTVVFF